MIQNNNPGNVRYSIYNNWQGQTGSDYRGFCIFSSMYYGVRAMVVIIVNDIRAGKNTITKIITEYAPPHENNTQGYINFVAARSGVGKNDPICSVNQLTAVVEAMIYFENGEALADAVIYQAANNLFNGSSDPVASSTGVLVPLSLLFLTLNS